MNLFPISRSLCLLAFGLALTLPTIKAETLDINHETVNGFPKALPISISGYPSDVDAVLKNDLLFMGIDAVSEDKAEYALSGKSDGIQVEGTLLNKINKNYLLRQAFKGGNSRAQAHALADAVAVALGRGPGIAQTKIAFKAQRGTTREIFIADFDGQNTIQVTQDNTISAAPAWAGRSALYYTSYKLGNPDIYYHNLSTGERHPVARYLGLNTSAAISPDGKHLAMILSKGGNPDLYVSDLNGGNLRRLTSTVEEESSPCWSPNSREICYTSKSSGANRLYRMPLEGGAARVIPTVGVSNCTEPDWSPDGKWIAFTSQAGSFRICIVDANKGGDAYVLESGEDPTWAPNSRAILFVRRQNNNRVLSLLDAASKRVKDVARVWESTSQPSWSR